MSTAALRIELMGCKVDIDRQLSALQKAGQEHSVELVDMKYPDGTYILPGLLLAKSNVLSGLAQLDLKATQEKVASALRVNAGRR